MLKSSADPAAKGLSPAGGAGLGAPKIPPPEGTPKGEAGATFDGPPNTLSEGVGAVPNIDVLEAAAGTLEPNKLLAEGVEAVAALPKIEVD